VFSPSSPSLGRFVALPFFFSLLFFRRQDPLFIRKRFPGPAKAFGSPSPPITNICTHLLTSFLPFSCRLDRGGGGFLLFDAERTSLRASRLVFPSFSFFWRSADVSPLSSPPPQRDRHRPCPPKSFCPRIRVQARFSVLFFFPPFFTPLRLFFASANTPTRPTPFSLFFPPLPAPAFLFFSPFDYLIFFFQGDRGKVPCLPPSSLFSFFRAGQVFFSSSGTGLAVRERIPDPFLLPPPPLFLAGKRQRQAVSIMDPAGREHSNLLVSSLFFSSPECELLIFRG